MKLSLATLIASTLVISPALAAPTPSSSAGSTASAPMPAPSVRPTYRFDFELTTTDGAKPPVTTAFSLNLAEDMHGDVMIGDNVPLASGGGSAAMRQNVGIQVGAHFDVRGADLFLQVETEISSLTASSTFHKVSARDVAIATAGKKTLVASIDHDHVHTQLSVTPTRL